MEKHRFFVVADDGHNLTGLVVFAYSVEQIEQIFGPDWITVYEDNFEDHELYRTRVEPYLDKLTYDVDNPTGALEYYMQKNGVVFSGSGSKKEIKKLARKFQKK